MKSNFPSRNGVPALPTRKRGPVDRKLSRCGGAGATAQQNIVEQTKVQQLEAKAAREAVLAAAPKSSPLTAKKFVEAISLDVDVDAARQLLLPGKGLFALPPSIGVLCQQLRKLDVSGNNLSDLSPLASLQHLSNLNVSRNPRLASLKGLTGTCLSVLNISYCAVDSLVGLEHTSLTLRTLIANDNRLQFQSPIFCSDPVVLRTLNVRAGTAEEQGGTSKMVSEMEEARAHLPATLVSAVNTNATAICNFVIFASFQQCEKVVLSRNMQLAHSFPSWNAEELAAACGDKSRHVTRDFGEESGDDSSTSGKNAAAAAAGQRRVKKAKVKGEEENTADAQSNKQLKHAMALAHPLSVFERLPRLKKLSLSGCELHSLPSRWFLPMVTELRLAQNHLISLQPDGVILRSLHILDISSNLFMSVATLRRCQFLEQLNVRGNPLFEEGVVEDKAAGLQVVQTKMNDEGSATSPASVTVVPVSVQQRVARLFPSLKLLDNQPVLSAEELRAAYKHGRCASAATQRAEASNLVASEEREIPEDNAKDGDETKSMGRAPGTTVEVAKGREQRKAHDVSPACKAARVDPAVIAAEADEGDVVVEAPPSVLKTTHVPIIRRERVLLRPGATAKVDQNDSSNANVKDADTKKLQLKNSGSAAAPAAPTVFGQAAVLKLLERGRNTSAW